MSLYPSFGKPVVLCHHHSLFAGIGIWARVIWSKTLAEHLEKREECIRDI